MTSSVKIAPNLGQPQPRLQALSPRSHVFDGKPGEDISKGIDQKAMKQIDALEYEMRDLKSGSSSAAQVDIPAKLLKPIDGAGHDDTMTFIENDRVAALLREKRFDDARAIVKNFY